MKPIAEEPLNWQRVRRGQLPGINVPVADPNAFVYYNRVTARVIDERQFHELLTRWETPVNVVFEGKKEAALADNEVKT